MIRLILKIWPALMPIILYLLWVFVVKKIVIKIFRKKEYIDADFDIIDKKTGKKREKTNKIDDFTLKNPVFVLILYISLILIIATLILLAWKS